MLHDDYRSLLRMMQKKTSRMSQQALNGQVANRRGCSVWVGFSEQTVLGKQVGGALDLPELHA